MKADDFWKESGCLYYTVVKTNIIPIKCKHYSTGSTKTTTPIHFTVSETRFPHLIRDVLTQNPFILATWRFNSNLHIPGESSFVIDYLLFDHLEF